MIPQWCKWMNGEKIDGGEGKNLSCTIIPNNLYTLPQGGGGT